MLSSSLPHSSSPLSSFHCQLLIFLFHIVNSFLLFFHSFFSSCLLSASLLSSFSSSLFFIFWGSFEDFFLLHFLISFHHWWCTIFTDSHLYFSLFSSHVLLPCFFFSPFWWSWQLYRLSFHCHAGYLLHRYIYFSHLILSPMMPLFFVDIFAFVSSFISFPMLSLLYIFHFTDISSPRHWLCFISFAFMPPPDFLLLQRFAASSASLLFSYSLLPLRFLHFHWYAVTILSIFQIFLPLHIFCLFFFCWCFLLHWSFSKPALFYFLHFFLIEAIFESSLFLMLFMMP